MESLPQPRESPAKVAAKEPVGPGSLSRFKSLAARLFKVDPERFKEALAKDEAERRARRGR